MANARNSRTTYPRKKARREAAADRFVIDTAKVDDATYMANKTQEAQALGLKPEEIARRKLTR